MCRIGTIYFDVKNKSPIYASDDKVITYFMICAMVKIGPFQWVMISFSDRKIWAPALLIAFVLLLNPESECEVRIISLEQYTTTSYRYVAH